MKTIIMLLFVSLGSYVASAQQIDTNTEYEKTEVQKLIERFLTNIGNYQLDSLPQMFNSNANIGGASYKDGKWNIKTWTFAEFLDQLKSRSNPTGYQEPVSKFTIHMDGGKLAFVKADAVLIKNGKALSNNFDYFTVIKEEDGWKILNGSYVSIPIDN